MDFTNLLTIAIPCFERKEYFLSSLESALNQTVKCEIIVVDNHSSHDYFEKICRDKGITYYRNEKNIGLFPNYNRCYALATTEYVKILDDDDILLPSYVESFLGAIERYPDIDVYYTDYLIISSKGTSNHKYKIPFGYIEKGYIVIEYGAKYKLGFPYLTATIRKSIAHLDLDSNMCIGGYDWVWIYSNADKLTFFGESEKLYYYRIHGNKSSRGKARIVNLLTHAYVFETIILNKISDKRLIEKVSENILWNLINVKVQGNKIELTELMKSENRFGNYLEAKLAENYKFKVIFLLPKIIIAFMYLTGRIVRRVINFSTQLN